MALRQIGWSTLFFTVFGLISFILGILAENMKPGGSNIQLIKTNNVAICHYPSDPSPLLGSLAIVFLFVSSSLAIASLFHPYDGKSIPQSAFWKSKLFIAFFVLSIALYVSAEALLIWATVTESTSVKNRRHSVLLESCPSAKTGLFGGAAFLALDSTLFWLICMMLITNMHSDHFSENKDENDIYVKVATEYNPALAAHFVPKV
ncbi:hypothetical protein O6H91_01G057900 [Diphasiastrum complanatum]|uniref:Uncharacterized protein n=1 Tax=Diphasiastrum complanatum TaxID=34168 RepID=A0ACC2ERH3_DIPCM|nr:hypothetical protein O6H91_01G057900 [Diphasiastrum complanatum]